MSIRLLVFLAASVGAILGLTAGVAVWTLQNWLPPLAPVVYLAAVLLALFLVLGVTWFVTTRSELERGIGGEGESAEERGFRRLVMLAAQVVLAIFGLALMSLWNVDAVRAYFVGWMTDTNVRLEKPLRDPSPRVVLAACEQMLRRGWSYRSKGALIAALDSQPAAAKACLATAKKKDWKGARLIAKELGNGWQSEMLAAGKPARARMCEVAKWAPDIDQLADRQPEVRLLECATGAQSIGVRECCVQVLEQRGALLKQLGDPASFPRDDGRDIFATLVQYGFRPLSLKKNQQKIADQLGTDDEHVRQWVAQLGCSLLDPTKAQPKILQGFFPLLESGSCGLSEDEQITYATPHSWVRLCTAIQDDPSDKPVEQKLCDAVKGARVEKVVDLARVEVHKALRARKLNDDADFVTSGVQAAIAMSGGAGRQSRRKRYMERRSEQIGKVIDLKRLGQGPTCRRLVFGRNTTGLKQLEDAEIVTSMDCENLDPTMTVGEYEDKYGTSLAGTLRNTHDPFHGALPELEKKFGKARAHSAVRKGRQMLDHAMKRK